jgi:hypothetical protein
LKNVIYYSPGINRPIGGVKIIHQHSELINTLGAKSEVFYAYGDYQKLDWFKHHAKLKSDLRLDPARDFVVLPEALIFDAWKRLKSIGVDYGIFVQNGYLVGKNLQQSEMAQCYQAAKLIICISEDAVRCVRAFFPEVSGKVIRVTYSVDSILFAPAEQKDNTIAYMPRKQKKHSDLLVPMLKRRLPAGWEVTPIDGMNENQVATALSKSKIFLAFSDFEGLPLPPVEAALSGNFVIGYTGQGGKEYWHPPVFTEVQSGDIVDFLDKTLAKVQSIDTSGEKVQAGHQKMLRENFSREREARLLKEMLACIERGCA